MLNPVLGARVFPVNNNAFWSHCVAVTFWPRFPSNVEDIFFRDFSWLAIGTGNIGRAETRILKFFLPDESINPPRLFSLTASRTSLAMFLSSSPLS